jgi:hypothetical protein
MNWWPWYPYHLASKQPAVLAPPPPSLLGEAALKVAIAELGRGEVGKNNEGPDIDRYRRGGSGGPWCAAFVSYCLEEGAKAGGFTWTVPRSHNAKRLFANCLKHGTKVARPMARDLVLWHRGAAGARTGHIGIVSRVDGSSFRSVEGNRGGFPSKVREYEHEIGEALLLGFCRLP